MGKPGILSFDRRSQRSGHSLTMLHACIVSLSIYIEDILTGIKRSLDRSDQEQRIAVTGHLLSDIAFYRGFTCSRDHDDKP